MPNLTATTLRGAPVENIAITSAPRAHNATTLPLRRTLRDKIYNAILQKKQIQPSGLAESSTVLFQNFDDQHWNWSTIELPRNDAKRNCKLLKSRQANASTKTGQKGCAG